ncbi:MAG: T9SS type A sorting domain-containing protein [Bacteroidia bacterium]|nr:T9SS type A sorting domain-containing protein [Bacteroidia bacterium]
MSKSLYPIIIILFFASGNIQAQSPSEAVGQKYYVRGYMPFSIDGFTLDQPFIGGFNSTQFYNMDLDNDGIDDLLCYDRNDAKILPFLRYGDSFFRYAPQYEAYFPKGSFYYITADLNSDGKWDIFTLSETSSLVIHKNITKAGDSFPKFQNLGDQYYRNQFVDPFPILFNKFSLSRTDMPAILDVDNDGDLDMVTYDATYTIYVMYSDVRADKGWSKDTFEFQKMDVCFGSFNDFNNTINLGVCPYKDKLTPRHVGGAALLMYDNDEDGDKEMVLSNIGVNHMFLLTNGKTENSMQFDSMVQWDSIYPKNTTRACNYAFPAGYYFDVNGDGVRDLVTSPNAFVDVKETEQLWYYRNNGKDNKPNFKFEKNNFLTDKNIDLGARTSPAFFDIDADGDLDMFVANNGDFEVSFGNKDRITFFENVGSKTNPSFKLMNKNWLNISDKNWSEIVIKFGDVDGDKDMDLLIGEQLGKVIWYENTAGANNPGVFQYKNGDLVTSTMASGESNAAPVVFNYNNDTLPDLLVGYYDGTVKLYVNEGSIAAPQYNRANTNAWGMRANEWSDYLPGNGFFFYGNATPEVIDIDKDGVQEILLGSAYGQPRLYHYNGHSVYDSLMADTSWLWQMGKGDSSKPDFGARIVPSGADLDGDSFPELFFGNSRGGLVMATTKASKSGIGIRKFGSRPLDFETYPNPSSDMVWVNRSATNETWNYYLRDVSGRIYKTGIIAKGETSIVIPTTGLSSGIYFIEVGTQNSKGVRKLIVSQN